MSGSSGCAQASRYFCPTSSAGFGRGRRIMYSPRSTAACVHSSIVAADDSYCTMVLIPRDCHLSKLPLGCDQAPMTKSGGVADGLAWLVISAKSVRDLSAVEAALS